GSASPRTMLDLSRKRIILPTRSEIAFHRLELLLNNTHRCHNNCSLPWSCRNPDPWFLLDDDALSVSNRMAVLGRVGCLQGVPQTRRIPDTALCDRGCRSCHKQ